MAFLSTLLVILSLSLITNSFKINRINNFITKVSGIKMIDNNLNADYLDETDYFNGVTNDSTNNSNNALQQLSLLFDCDTIDSDTISEFLFELGCLSVSCEVNSERDSYTEEKKWSDIIKIKNWKSAILTANFPSSFDTNSLIDVIKLTFPDILFDFQNGVVENKDWILHVQSSWAPMVIGDLTISFPWHQTTTTSTTTITPTTSTTATATPTSASSSDNLLTPVLEANKVHTITTPYHIILEGGAAFGTGDHPTTRLCLRWLQRNIPRYKGEPCNVLDYGCGSAILGEWAGV